MSENNNRTVMVGAMMLVAGGIIGAGVALLYAPQSGKKTRQDIARYSRKAKRRAEEIVDEIRGSVSELTETVSEKASELLDKGKDVAEDAKQDLLKALEEGQHKLEKQKNRLARIFS
jgi:gas vesicle protein